MKTSAENYHWIGSVKQEILKQSQKQKKLEFTTLPRRNSTASRWEDWRESNSQIWSSEVNVCVYKSNAKCNTVQAKEEQESEHKTWETSLGKILVWIWFKLRHLHWNKIVDWSNTIRCNMFINKKKRFQHKCPSNYWNHTLRTLNNRRKTQGRM